MGDWQPFFFDAAELQGRARQHADEYQTATPFPHVVLDDFLPSDVAHACVGEFPGTNEIAWHEYTDDARTLKLATEDEALMPPFTRQVVSQFNSAAVIRFLEDLTGITGLIPDPHLVGGGLHRIEPGGFLDIHADFNRHLYLDIDRRINLLLYLNPEWDESWAGHLELWDRTMTRCERRIAPVLNRCVIFNTTDISFHGHPDRLSCPPQEARKSLAFYYYSNGRPAEETSAPHSTIWQAVGQVSVPGEPLRDRPSMLRLRSAVGRRLPPRVRSAVRRASQVVGAARPAAVDTAPNGGVASAPENHWDRINRIYAALASDAGVARPQYTWSLLHVGDIARTLGIERFTAIEFGVAGGNGLVALEAAAEDVKHHLGVDVDVVGFDHGVGLPEPKDHRDAPYLMQAGQFAMDEARLRARLRMATLHIGLVRDTLDGFVDARPAPIGFIAFDLDYYSSTVDAFRLFEAGPEHFLPRVLCYMDDVLGYPWGDSNGERRAILDFNASQERRVIDHLPGLQYMTPPRESRARWLECMYLAHILDHPRYSEDEGVAIATRLDLA